jgi:pimeloyl-ACP methyl ester carboxylesterase
MQKKWRLLALGIVLILVGGIMAWLTQTSGGIRIQDVRFTGANGATMSALLYIPANATAKTPAPGILAVHGYINSRETQSAFAIEFARRGYVVLALDQTGHGYSSPPAFANGFGGPDGLKYLRSLDFVDRNNIGLEGHSMGGWTILAAATAAPNDYKSMVLVGSSTGKPFAAEGNPNWPRNLALVYARYDEFAALMWNSVDAREVQNSKKLWEVFGQTAAITPGRVYGSIETGNARVLYRPSETHPQNHISHESVGYAVDWFARTLKGGTPRPASDQIWIWKEIGTLIALVGFFVLLLGAFEVLLATGWFSGVAQTPPAPTASRSGRWWLAFALMTLVPAITFFPLLGLGGYLLPASKVLPQGITNQLMVWAIGNGIIALLLGWLLKGERTRFNLAIGPSIAIAALTVAAGYVAILLADLIFKIDFRYWIVALKPMNGAQFVYFLIYLIPFTAFFIVTFRAMHTTLPLRGDTAGRQYLVNILALALGFGIFLVIEYAALFANGVLIRPTGNPLEALAVIIGIQFLPLLAVVALISTFAYRRTNSYLPGALICGLFITWYIVAGQATQAV